MKPEWCLLHEKFTDGVLSDDEQRYLCELHESSEEFRLFWREASQQCGLIAVLEPVEELKSFLSASLFLEEKVRNKRSQKSIFSTIWKMAAISAAALIPLTFFVLNNTLPNITYSSGKNMSKWTSLLNEVELSSKEMILMKKGDIEYSIEGPGRFKLNFAGNIELKSGKLFVDTHSAGDVQVLTPRGSYKDIGTAFGVNVTQENEEVHVFDGIVNGSLTGEVKLGEARRISPENIDEIPVDRGGFTSFSQLSEKLDNQQKYKSLINDLNSRNDVMEIFDFTKTKVKSGSLPGIKGSNITIHAENVYSGNGPFPQTASVSFKQDLSYLKLTLPDGMENYSIILYFYHEEFEDRPISILSSIDKQVNFTQPMSWFTDNYGKQGFLDERFWVYRWQLIQVRGREVTISNLVDVNNRKILKGKPEPVYLIGNAPQFAVNFKGSIAMIAVMENISLGQMKKLFDNRRRTSD